MIFHQTTMLIFFRSWPTWVQPTAQPRVAWASRTSGCPSGADGGPKRLTLETKKDGYPIIMPRYSNIDIEYLWILILDIYIYIWDIPIYGYIPME